MMLTLFQLNVTRYLSIDFGMMGEFRQDLRDGFIEACLHLVNRDFDALAKDFVTLG
jgi:aarF domain-containing kinase